MFLFPINFSKSQGSPFFWHNLKDILVIEEEKIGPACAILTITDLSLVDYKETLT